MKPIRVKVVRRRKRKQYALRWADGERIAKARWGDERGAWEEAFALQDQLNSPAGLLSWADACEAYEQRELSIWSKAHRKNWGKARRRFELWCDGVVPPLELVGQRLPQFATDISREVARDTARGYCQYLLTFLNWCHDQGWLADPPRRVKFARRRKGEKVSKGRPLTGEEFDRLLAVIPKVVKPDCVPSWEFLVRGLWESSLRLGEAMRLHWSDGDVTINLRGKYPMIDFSVEGHKSRREQQLPITPEFMSLLKGKPQRGFVFRPQLSRGVTRNESTWSHTIGKFGRAAGIVVDTNRNTGKVKCASAHDLRRSFLDRWRGRVDTAILQTLARHESISTTERYYLGDQAEQVAAAIWDQSHEATE